MKTGAVIGFFVFLCGIAMLWSAGGLSVWANPADSAFMRAFAGATHHWMIPPSLGWFVAGTGAVLVGLKLQERKTFR